jgi:formylglycine-generating enzyme required for sulfatase activity
MPGKIFVSYRRDDDPNGAARVRDSLAARFGKTNIFMDVDNLLAGLRFDEELVKALAACDVFLAIIGTRWLDLLKAKAASGERDYVCEEISEALSRKIAVIPVRVGRDGQLAPLPRTDDLPPAIRDLVHYQKHDVTHEHFGRDSSALAEAIVAVRRHLRPTGANAVQHVPWHWISRTAISLLGIGYVGAYYAGVPMPWPGSPAAVTSPSAAERAAAEKKLLDDLALQMKQEREAKRESDAEAAAKEKGEGDRVRAAALAKQQAEEEVARRDPLLALTPGSGQAVRDGLANGQPCPMCPEMVAVPVGEFLMGRTPNQHRVMIRQPFAVGKFEVTFAEWQACATGGGCTNNRSPSDQGWGKGRRPVINVSWNDAKQYVNWLSSKTGRSYRLLSEAEWEYAARAGTTTEFAFGDSITTRQAQFSERSWKAAGKTVEVGKFSPNAWGLHDMHGNVNEWCEDTYHEDYEGAPNDGTAWLDGAHTSRMLRGGSWEMYVSSALASSWRGGVSPSTRESTTGFRIARAL